MSEFYAYSQTDPVDFGTDVALSAGDFGGDLELDESGDLVDLAGWDNLDAAIVRRLTTARGYLTRFIRDIEGLGLINDTYGNPAYRLLSEPVSNQLLGELQEGVRGCLAEEDRIVIISVDITLEPFSAGIRVVLSITYSAASSPDATRTVSLGQTADGFEIL